MIDKVAVVTGSNKGIGYVTVRELCRRGVKYVYLTARDERRGKEAVESLKNEGLKPNFYKLDVTDKEGVKEFANYLKDKHGGIDILINNAAVVTADFEKTTYEDSLNVINVNYFSILTIQKHLFPILKDNARVINLSSNAGHISNIENKEWVARLTKEDLKEEEVTEFVNWFLDSVRDGTLDRKDFVEDSLLAYRIAKVALTALTRIQQKQVGRGISVNALHPGYVKTNMTKYGGFIDLEQGADIPVYLALDADQSLKGKYIWYDKTEKDWADHELKINLVFESFMEYVRKVNGRVNGEEIPIRNGDNR